MELHIIKQDTGQYNYILLNNKMHIVIPVQEYLSYLLLRGKAPNTLKAYARDLKVFFDFLECRSTEYSAVDISTIMEYVAYLRSSDETELSLYVTSQRTPTTINRMLGTLYSFFCYHAAMRGIDNPILMKEINSPNSVFKNILVHTRQNNYVKQSIFKVKESDYHIHLFTVQEAKKLNSELITSRDRLIFKLLLQTGARIGEILELKIKDVPIPDDSTTISVLHGIKSKGGYRDLYMPTELLVELDTFIIENRLRIKMKHDYIFVSQHVQGGGDPLSYRAVYDVFKRAGEKAGLNFKFHDTRHTFVTALVESGMDISIVRMIAGHKHITTTQQYVTLSSDYLAKSLSQYWSLNSVMGGLDGAK